MADSRDVLAVRLTTEGIQDVMAALKRVQGEVGKTGKAGKDAGEALGALGTLFAARQIAAFAAHAIDAADGLYKMSQKTGIAVAQLSVLTYQGQQAEVSNEDLEKSLVKLAKSFDLLEKGDAGATEAFRRIGLSAQDLKGLSLDQVLLKVANAQNQFADGAGKAATMVALLGKSGANMIPLMKDLADGGFDHAKAKLQDLGLVISEDMAKASQDFNDSMKRLEMAAGGATVQLAQSFLPALTKALDGTTGALAATPAPIKAFIGGTIGMGAAATATIVAVRTLWGALAGLGPIGIAVIALSALVSGYAAIQAAAEEAQAEAVKANQEQLNRVQRGGQLVEQYKKETQALEKGGLSADKRREHEARLKAIKDDLIKLSPSFQDALGKETQGYKEATKALDEKLQKEREELENKKKAIAAEFAKADAYQKRVEAEANAPAEVMTGSAQNQDMQATQIATLPMRLEDARRKAALLKAQLDALAPPESKQDEKKPSITATDKDALKAGAAAQVAQIKRAFEQVKQAEDALTKEYEDMYSRGLLDLTTYLEARKALIEKGTASEIAVIESQIKAEKVARANAATPAEKITATSRIADLEAQALLKRAQGVEKLRELERKGRDEAIKNTQEALNLEAELAQAKGITGEAGIRAIEAEYARKIQLEKTDEAVAARTGLRDYAVAKFKLSGVESKVDLAQRNLDVQLGGVDAQQAQGRITEEEAIRRKIALYQGMIPVLAAAAAEQLKLATTTGNPEDLLKAQENVVAVEKLKASLAGLGEQANWMKTSMRDAFQQGLGNLLMDLTDQTTTLTQKMLALGKAIAQALLQQATARFAATITTSLFGAPAKMAGGGRVYGPGTTTSDSVPAWLSRDEFVVRAAAVNHYGAGLFHSLNGMHFPKGSVPGFADGGLVGGGGGGTTGWGQPLIGSISIVVQVDGSSKVSAPPALEGVGRAFRDGVVGVVKAETRPGGKLYGLRG